MHRIMRGREPESMVFSRYSDWLRQHGAQLVGGVVKR
jgi:hypothetical protein